MGEDVDVAVVGAGLAGLVAATAARDAGATVAVWDVTEPGGRARSELRDGFVLNRGPRALFRRGAAARVLAELGVAVSGRRPPLRGAAMVVGGTVHPVGRGLLSGAVIGRRSAARLVPVIAGLGREDPRRLALLSTASWLDSWNLDGDARLLAEALVRLSTYCDDLDLLSADAAVAQLLLVTRHGVTYVDGGWQSIVDALLAGLPPVRRGLPVEVLEPGRPMDGVSARSIILACGGPAAALRLLPADPGWGRPVPSRASCLDLGLVRPPRHWSQIGLDEPTFLTAQTVAARLAPPGAAVVHIHGYGGASRERLEAVARRTIPEEDVVVSRYLHAMTVSTDLPRAERGGLAGRPAEADTGVAGMFVAGDWVGAEGLLADAAVASGRRAGLLAARHAAAVARVPA